MFDVKAHKNRQMLIIYIKSVPISDNVKLRRKHQLDGMWRCGYGTVCGGACTRWYVAVRVRNVYSGAGTAVVDGVLNNPDIIHGCTV